MTQDPGLWKEITVASMPANPANDSYHSLFKYFSGFLGLCGRVVTLSLSEDISVFFLPDTKCDGNGCV